MPDTEIPTESTEHPTPDTATDAAAERAEPETFGRDYVEKIRAEAAAARVKAKSIDTANERLLVSYATQDGRLVDANALIVSDDLIGDDGLVDRAKVAEAIGALVADKPYLQSRRPTAALPMGVRPEVPADVSWLAVLRGDIR